MITKNFEFDDFIDIIKFIDNNTDEFLYVYDLDEDAYYYSPKMSEVFSIRESNFKPEMSVLQDLIHPDDFEMVNNNISEGLAGTIDKHDLEYRWKNKDGKYSWINCRGDFVENNGKHYLIGRISEIGKQHRFDNLTGLYYESILESTFSSLVDQSENKGFIMIVGIDNFKEINEKYGNRFGDDVLALLSDILKEYVNEPFRLFRLKGDEFGILMPDSSEDVGLVAKKLYKRVRNKIDYEAEQRQFDIFFNISAGAVAFDVTKDDYSDLMRNARFSLHSAKINGKNRFEFFTNDKYQNYIHKLSVLEELRRCITNNFEGFELFYQPIFDAKTEKLVGAESLIRWNSAKFGFMSPVEFIPLLEESSLIIPLGRWIIETATKTCNTWISNIPDFVIHINLSIVQLIQSNIIKDAFDIISRFSAANNHFVFEITESLQMESSKNMTSLLEAFNENDFALAIDDFGTGYSNFEYMRDKLFKIVKIDRSFITDINLKHNNYLMVGFIIKMAHEMGLTVCIEGVETKEELNCVVELGADVIQGYYYGKPVNYKDFEETHIRPLFM